MRLVLVLVYVLLHSPFCYPFHCSLYLTTPNVTPFLFSLSAAFSLHDCHPHPLFLHPSLSRLPILIVVCPFSCGLQLLHLSALLRSQPPSIRSSRRTQYVCINPGLTGRAKLQTQSPTNKLYSIPLCYINCI